MQFKEWLLTEDVQIVAPSAGDQIAAAEVMDKALPRRPLDKKLAFVGKIDGKVVGAAYSKIEPDKDASKQAGYPVNVYDFDVGVDPKYQGFAKIGIRLIDACIAAKPTNPYTYMRLWVVNPKLIDFLESHRGFDVESRYEGGSAHLVKY